MPRSMTRCLSFCIAVALFATTYAAASPLGTSFAYQGELKDSGTPVNNAAMPMSFNLYDAATNGTLVAGPIDQTVAVTDGLFTVEPDFGGAAFDGSERWLEVIVNGVTLAPRQRISAVPYALQTRGLYTDGSGHVGVGTTSPAAGVHLSLAPNAGVGFFSGDLAPFGYAGLETNFSAPSTHIWCAENGSRQFSVGAGGNTFVAGSLDIGTSAAGSRLHVAGSMQIDGTNALEFGAGLAGKQVDAGKIGYQTFSNGLDIVGAGTNGANRRIQMWAEGGTTFTGPIVFQDGTSQSTAAAGWSLNGNAGVGNGFVGTTDNAALVMKANGHRVMQYQYVSGSALTVNVLGGSDINSIFSGVIGATIAGGGWDNFSGTDYPNAVEADFGSVGGGYGNWTYSPGATIAGGSNNTAGLTLATGTYSTVAGGFQNAARGNYSMICGGAQNIAGGDNSAVAGSGNTAYGYSCTVAGGNGNQAGNNLSTQWSTVGGGTGNWAYEVGCTVGGGTMNLAHGPRATVAGGDHNAAYGYYSAVGGGDANTANGDHSNVAGGSANTALSFGSNVAGGVNNLAGTTTVGQGYYSAVGGGTHNTASGEGAAVAGGGNNTAQGFYSMVGGGTQNQAGDYSFAAGSMARALSAGSFVWADRSTNAPFQTTLPNQFLIQAANGVGINTNNPSGFALKVAGAISCTSLTQTSDARFKKNVADIDNALASVLGLRGVTFDWNRDVNNAFPDGRQIGFIAQEVERVMPELVTTDTTGHKSVAYANVVPVLVEAFKTEHQELVTLKTENAELRGRLDRIEALLKANSK